MTNIKSEREKRKERGHRKHETGKTCDNEQRKGRQKKTECNRKR